MPAEPLCALVLESGAEPLCVEGVHALVDELALRVPDLRPEDRWRLETAVIEVAGNIVEHGGPEVRLRLRLTAYADTVEALFTDTGTAVVLQTPLPRAEDSAEQGRGLALATALIDQVEYERAGTVNRWRLQHRRGG